MISVQKLNNNLLKLLIYISVIFLLTLASSNINDYLTPKKVLGAEIEVDNAKDEEFWRQFLTKNPDYIPGWIELGDFERVHQIDPNYFLQP